MKAMRFAMVFRTGRNGLSPAICRAIGASYWTNNRTRISCRLATVQWSGGTISLPPSSHLVRSWGLQPTRGEPHEPFTAIANYSHPFCAVRSAGSPRAVRRCRYPGGERTQLRDDAGGLLAASGGCPVSRFLKCNPPRPGLTKPRSARPSPVLLGNESTIDTYRHPA